MDFEKDYLVPYILSRLRETPNLSQKRISKDGNLLRRRSGYLKFRKYIDDYLDGFTGNRFIIMPGLRGVGKTTLLFQLYQYLTQVKNIEQDRVLYISTDHLKEYLGARILDAIDVFINEIHHQTPATLDKEVFIFIDEAQYDEGWSRAGKIIFDQSEKIFMIFTGSSALNLEINIDAVRRTKKESIFPMNFQEYILLKHEIYPPKGTSKSMRDLIFNGFSDGAMKKEKKINRKLLKLSTPPEKEWENYLCCGGFPIGFQLNNEETHERTFNMIERVIEKDVSLIQSIRSNTRGTIFKILMYLALQKPGETSENKLAKNIGTSSSSIKNILNLLEKSHLIFPITPYSGSASKTIRKAWKYYFLSPSIKASINFMLGKYIQNDRQLLGLLAENLVASYFFRTKETVRNPSGIFYSPEKKGVDFILTKLDGEIIPVEVGIGKKNKGQIKRAINKYDSKYGLVVSNATNTITQDEDVIYIPLITFSYL